MNNTATPTPVDVPLIVTQSLTFLLLVISEAFPFSASPYGGILHAIIGALRSLTPPEGQVPVAAT